MCPVPPGQGTAGAKVQKISTCLHRVVNTSYSHCISGGNTESFWQMISGLIVRLRLRKYADWVKTGHLLNDG
jgi:hypothetical protein